MIDRTVLIEAIKFRAAQLTSDSIHADMDAMIVETIVGPCADSAYSRARARRALKLADLLRTLAAVGEHLDPDDLWDLIRALGEACERWQA